jgi:putative hydrolase of the HAD superfamily
MVRYPVVLFDVGGTLVGPRESYGAVYGRVLGRLGVELPAELLDRSIGQTSAEMARLIPAGRDRFTAFDGGESGFWLRFVDEVFRRAAGRRATPGFLRQALAGLWEAFGRTSAWRVHDDVLPTLEALRGQGARLGVVSNWDSRLSRLLELLELAGYFETIGVSHVEGVEKPDPALFLRVLERMGVDASDALHVGDVAELDLEGARAAGIDALLIDRDAAPGANSTIRDLREVPPIAAGQVTPGRA